jgi:hypothetical protein
MRNQRIRRRTGVVNAEAALIYGVIAAIVTALTAAIATRVRVLPEVIDISIIPTIAGVGAITFSTYGALRRFSPDRVARMSLLGTLLGTILGAIGLTIALLIDVL